MAALMDNDFGIVCEDQGAACRVSLSGRLTIDSSPDLRNLLLQRLQSSSCQSLIVDFYEVEYMDTSGLAILVEILKVARIQGKTFQLGGLQERPRYVLETSRLLQLFDELKDEMAPPDESRPGGRE
jgi:anti-sigma B factor antagonist